MLRNLLFLLTVGLLLAMPHSSFAQQNCPPAVQLAPCTCDEATLNWECSGFEVIDFNLKAIFDRVSPLVDPNTTFNHLDVSGLMKPFLLANTMSSLKFRGVHIHETLVEVMHPDAFNETYGVTTSLDVSWNRLQNPFDPYDNFNFISKFRVLETLVTSNNFIRNIPTDPFPQPLPNLTTWKMGLSTLEMLGSRIFANLPGLRDADWHGCDLSINEFASDTFEGIGPDVVLNLEHNPFSRLPQDIFKVVMDSAAGLRVGGYQSPSIIEFDCDEVSGWLCGNETLYRPKLSGFVCRKESGYADIWAWCVDNGK